MFWEALQFLSLASFIEIFILVLINMWSLPISTLDMKAGPVVQGYHRAYPTCGRIFAASVLAVVAGLCHSAREDLCTFLGMRRRVGCLIRMSWVTATANMSTSRVSLF